MPTIDRPKIDTIKSSGLLNMRTMGRATRINTVKNAAPISPPKSDEAKAAERARAALPFLAMGNPSKTVACDAEDPGIPISTDAKVSEVGMTAIIPIINANPNTGSIPNINGSKSERPAMPPSPGKTPIARPIATPNTKYPSTIGCKICPQADDNAGKASTKNSTKLSFTDYKNAPLVGKGGVRKSVTYFSSTPKSSLSHALTKVLASSFTLIALPKALLAAAPVYIG